MKNVNINKTDPFPENEKPKKRGRKSLSREKGVPVDMQETDPSLVDIEEAMKQTIANIIQNSTNQYEKVAENQFKETRDDFECLQPIVSEFLDDFLIIGHTLDGQRVVIRYTKTPADMDKLTELCKKVLVRMMIAEQNGQ